MILSFHRVNWIIICKLYTAYYGSYYIMNQVLWKYNESLNQHAHNKKYKIIYLGNITNGKTKFSNIRNVNTKSSSAWRHACKIERKSSSINMNILKISFKYFSYNNIDLSNVTVSGQNGFICLQTNGSNRWQMFTLFVVIPT